MVIKNTTPISGILSKLLKDTLTAPQIKDIAKEYDVHYNTIINIRDRKKKEPDKFILRSMINKAITNQTQQIISSAELITLLRKELENIL
ncbi:hypothetical protein [Aquimarina aquimarini]|uniref:hypothetical protein n=1 Tax=Aquimarina aquimarini TaxID=1191734 RepID=UPI000D55CD62|nr:hypothetical protein [Aquimarina aquimarini]